MMHRNKSVSTHNFAMVPKADIPRSSFRMQHVYKTAFNASYLIPIYVDEMLPGDTFNMRMTAFARLATPIFPTLDNLKLHTFFFAVPNRLVWDNWVRFMGERDPNPDSSISFTIPQQVSPADGYEIGSLQDYMGLPTLGQVTTGFTVSHSALPLRAYNLIWNEWFRDQNLQNSAVVDRDDGPDNFADYNLLRRNKKHDYFTGCLPFTQKGTAISIPLGGAAPVVSTGEVFSWVSDTVPLQTHTLGKVSGSTGVIYRPVGLPPTADGEAVWAPPGLGVTGLEADLSAATGTTVNLLRQSFQVQKLLERDARGGTRYTELVRAHFGVISPDARLQRPEYIGGGSGDIVINPIAQTSATSADGTDTPQGNLAAVGTGLMSGHGFTYSATEHTIIIGLAMARVDNSYQQGMRRMWSRSTRYDFYFPVFAMLGEQAVLNKEIYTTGQATDNDVFGYQERWAEYRYFPSMITGLMRSTAAGTIDPWHYAEDFDGAPALNEFFISDRSFPILQRSLAVGIEANGQQLLLDCFFDCRAARPMPMYSVPGLIDHF